MVIKSHLSGVAIAYEPTGGNKTGLPATGRPQGSLYNQQKRAIADAVEFMRGNYEFAPLFFVATSPGFIPASEHTKKISKFVHNLKNGYGMRDFVWVRELTVKGCPHYHFIASFLKRKIDPVKMSVYWSGLFGKDAKNSVRLGTKPYLNKQGFWERKYRVDSPECAYYVSKYMGKDLDIMSNDLAEAGWPQIKFKKTYRSFAISEQARMMSQPVMYEPEYFYSSETRENYPGQTIQVKTFVKREFQNDLGVNFDSGAYDWKQIDKMHSVFFGRKISKSQ